MAGDAKPKEVPKITSTMLAKRLGVDSGTVRKWALYGVRVGEQKIRLNGHRVGDRWRFDEADITAFCESCRVAGEKGGDAPAVPTESLDERQKRFNRKSAEVLARLGG
jgi:hypothetical protein